MNATISQSNLTPKLSCNMYFFFFLHFFSKHNNSLSNERFRQSTLANLPPQAMKHLWIRTALMEKLLDKIVLHLVENSRFIVYYLLLNISLSVKKSCSCSSLQHSRLLTKLSSMACSHFQPEHQCFAKWTLCNCLNPDLNLLNICSLQCFL